MKCTVAGRKSVQSQQNYIESAPMMSPEEWENHLIAMSYQAVEDRIRNGTATAAEYVHFLRAGSAKQREEMQKLREENALLKAKTSAIESAKDRAVSYREVIDAFTSYRSESTDVPINPYIYEDDTNSNVY